MFGSIIPKYTCFYICTMHHSYIITIKKKSTSGNRTYCGRAICISVSVSADMTMKMITCWLKCVVAGIHFQISEWADSGAGTES